MAHVIREHIEISWMSTSRMPPRYRHQNGSWSGPQRTRVCEISEPVASFQQDSGSDWSRPPARVGIPTGIKAHPAVTKIRTAAGARPR